MLAEGMLSSLGLPSVLRNVCISPRREQLKVHSAAGLGTRQSGVGTGLQRDADEGTEAIQRQLGQHPHV